MPIDDFMKQFGKLRSRGSSPKLSYSEVLAPDLSLIFPDLVFIQLILILR
jgi:hypothetical protein